MAIVALDKLTIYGLTEQKADVLDGLQQLGCLHLVNLQGNGSDRPELVSKEAREALRYLFASPVYRRVTSSRVEFDRDQLIHDVLGIKHRLGRLREERANLQRAISDLERWGDFHLPPADALGEHQFWFYVIPLRSLSDLPSDRIWHVANTDHRFAYVVVLAPEEPEELSFKPVELDRHPLSHLRQRLENLEEELEELYWQRVTLTRWRNLLQNDLDAADDKAARLAAAQETLDDHAVFAVQGWVPQATIPDIQQFADQHQLAITIEPACKEDAPPTLLENPKRVAGAEGCVTFYITPSYHSWDPTTIVFFSFSLFFAMIMADAGYGLLLAGLLLLLWGKLGGSRQGVQFRNLLLGIVSVTILYGVIVGSYFGMAPKPGSSLDHLQIKLNGQPLMSNQTAMMVIAVAIGVAHLVLANVISAWQKRESSRCLGYLGWALIMLGALIFGGGKLAQTQSLLTVGILLLSWGAVGVLLFSSDLPLASTSILTHLRRLVDGVMQFANLSKAFGDTLSYLRLFALGLASAQLAQTFNGLASDAARVGGIGVLLALLLLVVGHGINLLLGLMGGVVHGLRLNCIEFFNWSLTDEGYSFEPFKKKAEM